MKSKVNQVAFPVDQMNPRVLKSYLFREGMTYLKGEKLPGRFVYDYELEFFTESDGYMQINDRYFPIHRGDIVFRRPGQFTRAIMPFCCYLICFDLASNTGKEPATYDFCTSSAEENKFQDNYINTILESIPHRYHPAASEKFWGLFESVCKEYTNPNDASPMLLKAYTLQIISQLFLELNNPLNPNSVFPSPHGMMVKKAADYIKNNLESPILLEKLAGRVKLSPAYFHKIFRSIMKMTPNEYQTRLRMERAQDLLSNTNQYIYKVAYECGYENTPYFSSLFKRYHGISPLEFRKRHGVDPDRQTL